MSGSIDSRKAAILRAVVDEYVKGAEPVGSSHVARVAGMQVSPATIRNEMNVLEHEGYLVQPHTSAGRIPTDKGYRYYVDTFVDETQNSDVMQFKSVEEFFTKAQTPPFPPPDSPADRRTIENSLDRQEKSKTGRPSTIDIWVTSRSPNPAPGPIRRGSI